MIKNTMKVSEFLAQKSEFGQKIDLFRSFRIYEKYKKHLHLKPIIHILGTNGKGSTGRFLAQLLEGLNFKVGHFSSPHIFTFNERFYLEGGIVNDELLNKAHKDLQSILKEDLECLSYFEYSTFLAAFVFKDCDFVIFEAGLGGEYDASCVFEKKMSIFTKIGLDHMQILGKSLKKIARTKLKAMSKETLISKEQEQDVLLLAHKIAFLKKSHLHLASDFEGILQEEFELYSKKHFLPEFLKHNLNLALNACVFLLSKEQCLQALKNLPALNLQGRCQKLNENLYIDVGHNQMAAKALCEKFKGEKLVLIVNFFLDKDIFEILKTLKPIIDTIQLYKYHSPNRTLCNELIFDFAKDLGLKCEVFTQLIKDKKSLVFGSFMLVENFLKEYSDKK